MRAIGMASAAMLVLAGCAESPRVRHPAALASGGVPGPEVTLSFPAGAPYFGDLVRVRIGVVNGYPSAIVVRALDLGGQLPETECWLTALSGRTEQSKKPARCEWHPSGGGTTAPVFAAGLLLPGEVLEVERWYRVRVPEQEIAVRYQVVSDAALRSDVYLPTDRLQPPTGRPHKFVFGPPELADLAKLRRLRPGDPARIAIVPGVESWRIESRRVVLSVAMVDRDAAAGILAELGGEAGELSRSSVGEAWLVRTPHDGAVTVRADAGGEERFEQVGLEVFDLLDAGAAAGLPIEIAGRDAGSAEVEPGAAFDVLREAARRRRGVHAAVLEPLGPRRRLALVVE